MISLGGVEALMEALERLERTGQGLGGNYLRSRRFFLVFHDDVSDRFDDGRSSLLLAVTVYRLVSLEVRALELRLRVAIVVLESGPLEVLKAQHLGARHEADKALIVCGSVRIKQEVLL